MKKQKTWALVLFLAMLLLIASTSCTTRSPDSASSHSESETEQPREEALESFQPEEIADSESSLEDSSQAVEEAEMAARLFFDALLTGSREEIAAETDYTNLFQLQEGQGDENLLAILRHLSYEVVETKVLAGGKAASAEVKTATVDMNKVYPEYLMRAMELQYNNALSNNPTPEAQMEEEYHKILLGLLQNADKNAHYKTLDVQLSLLNGQWRVQVDDALRSAVFGDYFVAQANTGENAAENQGG